MVLAPGAGGTLQVAPGFFELGAGGELAGFGFGELGLAEHQRVGLALAAKRFPVFAGLRGFGHFLADGSVGLGDGALGDDDGGGVVAVVEFQKFLAGLKESAFPEGG